jgi:hypothetical protein
MQATLHPGESVVPRDFASGMRASGVLGGEGAGGSGDTYGDTHIHGPLVHAETNASPEAIFGHISRALRNAHPIFRGLR